MSKAAVGAGNAYDATGHVGYDPQQSIRDLKARLAAVRELCDSKAADGSPLSPSEVLTILDRQE